MDRHDSELGVGGTALGVRLGANHGSAQLNRLTATRRNLRAAELQRTYDGVRGIKVQRHTPSAGVSNAAQHRQDLVARSTQLRRLQGRINEVNRKAKTPLVSRGMTHKLIVGSTVVGAGGLWSGLRGKGTVQKYTRRQADAFAVGTLAGGGAYQEASYHLKGADRRAEAKIADDAHLKAVLRAHQKTHGINQKGHRTVAGDPAWKGYFRNYPKSLPGSRLKRTLSYTHGGKTGFALTSAVGLGTGLTAAHAVRPKVSKSQVVYGYQQRQLSPVRTTETAAGLALGAWGASRMKSLNQLAAYGMRMAEKNGGGAEAEKALEAARRLAEATRRQTGKGERALRQNARFNAAVEAVPPPLRPAVATTAGALLVAHAHPVHTERFHRT